MEKDKDLVELVSKDLEFVKDVVQDTSKRINSLESSMSSFEKDFAEHMATDRQLAKEIERMGRTLERNTDSLVEHMRRTEINELNIEELKNISQKIDERLRPVEEQAAGVRAIVATVLKMGGIIGGIATMASMAYKLFKYMM